VIGRSLKGLESGWLRRPWTIALAVALPLALAYLILAPPAADLAAATYRSDLFAREGFTTWDTGWYAAHGHWLPGYSLLSPMLGALLGVRVLLSLSAVAASTLFAGIAERVFGTDAARLAAGWFAFGFCVGLLSGRVPYDLGFAIGLGSVLALMRGAVPLALVLAALTSVASPVAGAFLALAGLASTLPRLARVRDGREHDRRTTGSHEEESHPSWNPGVAQSSANPCGEGDRPSWSAGRASIPSSAADSPVEGRPGWSAGRAGAALAAAALTPIAVLSLAYPEGGYEPFAASAFWPELAAVLAIAALLPQGPLTQRGRLVLRVGAALYALALVGAYAIHTPVGGNAARLGPVLAAPLLAGVLWDKRRGVLLLLAPALLYWQLVTPIRDYRSIVNDPSVNASYYTPLLRELRRMSATQTGQRAGNAGRHTIVEVPLTKAHWEAAYLAGHDGVELARGWERQLDTRYAALFYRPTLTASAYRAWLAENGVQYVALPDTRLDAAGRLEAGLIAGRMERADQAPNGLRENVGKSPGLPYLRELWHSKHWRLYRFMG
jgi:hypothetical protein